MLPLAGRVGRGVARIRTGQRLAGVRVSAEDPGYSSLRPEGPEVRLSRRRNRAQGAEPGFGLPPPRALEPNPNASSMPGSTGPH